MLFSTSPCLFTDKYLCQDVSSLPSITENSSYTAFSLSVSVCSLTLPSCIAKSVIALNETDFSPSFHLCQDMKTYVSAPNQSCCTAYRRQGLLRDESMQTCHYTLSLRLRNRQGYNHNGRSDCLVHIHLKGMCLLRPVSYMHGKMHLLFPSLSEGLPVSSMRVIQFFFCLDETGYSEVSCQSL